MKEIGAGPDLKLPRSHWDPLKAVARACQAAACRAMAATSGQRATGCDGHRPLPDGQRYHEQPTERAVGQPDCSNTCKTRALSRPAAHHCRLLQPRAALSQCVAIEQGRHSEASAKCCDAKQEQPLEPHLSLSVFASVMMHSHAVDRTGQRGVSVKSLKRIS